MEFNDQLGLDRFGKKLLKKKGLKQIVDIVDLINRFSDDLARQMQVNEDFVLLDDNKRVLGQGTNPVGVWNNIVDTQGYDKAEDVFLNQEESNLSFLRLSSGASLELGLGLDLSKNERYKSFILACSFTDMVDTFERRVDEALEKLSTKKINVTFLCTRPQNDDLDRLLLISYRLDFKGIDREPVVCNEFTGEGEGRPHILVIKALHTNFKDILKFVMGNDYILLSEKLKKEQKARLTAQDKQPTKQGESHELIVY